jgi:hypothetical protein
MGIRDAVEAATGETVEFGAVTHADEDTAPAPPASAPGSVLSELRARAAQLTAQQTVDLDVPGYNGVLVARYGASSIGRIYGNSPENALNPKWTLAADALGRALVGLYGRDAVGDPQPLDFGRDTKFDDDLVEMLDLHPTERTVRAVLVALCGGGELGESRVWAHFMAYQGWLMAGADGDSSPELAAAEAAVGEFPGR